MVSGIPANLLNATWQPTVGPTHYVAKVRFLSIKLRQAGSRERVKWCTLIPWKGRAAMTVASNCRTLSKLRCRDGEKTLSLA
jgi:hypothetical protein